MDIENHIVIQEKRAMSFFTFLADNYELSKFVLPKKRPQNDHLDSKQELQLKQLMQEKDFYEINSIIKSRYSGA